MNRVTRKLVSWFGIAAVLFAQFTVAAHACSMHVADLGESAETVEISASGAPDRASAALCQKHCENGQQNVSDSASPLSFAALAPALVLAFLPDPVAPSPQMVIAPSLRHATSPPLSIRNCCFRI